MKNSIFKAQVQAAFEKLGWPYNPSDVAASAGGNVAKNIHRGESVLHGIGEAAKVVPQALDLGGSIINKVLAPAGTAGLKAMGAIGSAARNNPGLLRAGATGAVLAPILWNAFDESQQKNEKDLLAMNRDPSRVITASLDEFLEKKAATQTGFPGFGSTPWYSGIGKGVKDQAIGSFTEGMGQGIGKGIVDQVFGGIGGVISKIRDIAFTDPKRAKLLESLIRTDPTIGDFVNRDPHNLEVLQESFGTMVRFAPKLSMDPNATRSFLREVAMSGSGVNYSSIKSLIETEKTLTQGFQKRD